MMEKVGRVLGLRKRVGVVRATGGFEGAFQGRYTDGMLNERFSLKIV